MRALLLSGRLWLFFGGFASLVVVSSLAVHPSGSVKQTDRNGVNISDLTMPFEVKTLFERSCGDCHSNQTKWPWYSYVAPVSWMVERDVRRGRDHMNLSYWPQYSLKRQEQLLADIASVVKNREMPLPQYALIHKTARLSDSDLNILYQWARIERRKTKTALASSTRPEDMIGRQIPSVTLNRYDQSPSR